MGEHLKALRLPYSSARELFRRMVFNVAVRNQDDHTKNISFLMDGDGRWRLSPAYDMGYAYNPHGGWTAMHQMSVNGKFDAVTREDLLSFAAANGIKDAGEVIGQVCDAMSLWPRMARECGVPEEMIAGIEKNMCLVAD